MEYCGALCAPQSKEWKLRINNTIIESILLSGKTRRNRYQNESTWEFKRNPISK